MNKIKISDDLLPDDKSVYFKSFDKVNEGKIVKEEEIINKIKTVFDPEIPVNIYDLGLIYSLDNDKNNNIAIKMTLTTPNCPVAGSMPKTVGEALSDIPGISSIRVEFIWEPKWNKDMMSEDAKLALDMF